MCRPDLLTDARFTRLADRAEHGEEINGIVADWTASLSAAQVEAACIDHDVPVATAYTVADIFADHHMAVRGDIVTVDDPVLGPIRQQAPFPRTPGAPPPSGAPRLGEHTREVLAASLGLGNEELDRLAADGVI
jgi:formyl-CoA transferase